ncbi:MAG: HAD family hydrolase, partial [Clostridia bacterium]|nr:HAD family hydrolase [Clostridia bacterium]
LGIVPSLLPGNWHEWMRIAFTFMILAGTGEHLLQGPLCFENGLGTAFYNGVLVRGDGPFEQLANAEKVVFNKTGTLTKGEPDVIDIIPAEGYKAATLLEMAAKAEALSGHRIADCIRKAYGKEIDEEELVGFTETPGLGVIVYVNGHRLVAGNARCMLAEGIDVRESHQAGNKLHVAVDQKYMGCIVTSDNARKDSEETIRGLHDMGLSGITMLTGGARGPSSSWPKNSPLTSSAQSWRRRTSWRPSRPSPATCRKTAPLSSWATARKTGLCWTTPTAASRSTASGTPASSTSWTRSSCRRRRPVWSERSAPPAAPSARPGRTPSWSSF